MLKTKPLCRAIGNHSERGVERIIWHKLQCCKYKLRIKLSPCHFNSSDITGFRACYLPFVWFFTFALHNTLNQILANYTPKELDYQAKL